MKQKSAIPLFIEEERAKGKSDEEIRHQLLDAGWKMDIIQSAMQADAARHTGLQPVPESLALKLLKNPLLYIGVVILLLLMAMFI